MGIKIGNDTFEIKGGSDWLNTGNHYCEVSAEHEVDDKERDVITLTFTSEYGAQTFRHFLHTDMCRKISIEQLGKILNYVGIENSEQLTYSSYKEFVEGFNKQMEKKPVHINIYKNKDGWNAYKLMWSRKGMSLQDDEKSAGEYKEKDQLDKNNENSNTANDWGENATKPNTTDSDDIWANEMKNINAGDPDF